MWTDVHLMNGHMQHARDGTDEKEDDGMGTSVPDQDNAPWRTQLVSLQSC